MASEQRRAVAVERGHIPVVDRVSVLVQGASYPPITLTVNVAPDAPISVVTNVADVFGGGDADPGNNTALDNTHIAGFRFVPVTPCRIADTRNATGPFGGPFIGANATREINIPSSACGIPATAQAYSLNITVVPKSTLGFLTMFPCGQNRAEKGYPLRALRAFDFCCDLT